LQCVAVDEFQGLINRLPVREATNTEATQHHEKTENKMPAAALCDSIIWNQIQKGWCRMAVLLSHLHCLGGRLMIVIKSALCLRRVARRNALLLLLLPGSRAACVPNYPQCTSCASIILPSSLFLARFQSPSCDGTKNFNGIFRIPGLTFLHPSAPFSHTERRRVIGLFEL
jgi:hypothetical protein